MISAKDAITAARALLGTPYSELDCINLIKRVIRTAPGGVPGYTTAGTNTLWRSYEASAKYKDLTWRQEGLTSFAPLGHLPQRGRQDARAGMLAFKRSGDNVHHVGLVTSEGTVIHSRSAKGCVVETALDSSWHLLAIHRYIETAEEAGESEETNMTAYKMRVVLEDTSSTLNVRNEPGKAGERIGRLGHGAVVTVQEELASGWKRITYGDSGSGYVDGSFLVPYDEPAAPETPRSTIIDSEDNHFNPAGDWRVIVGSLD